MVVKQNFCTSEQLRSKNSNGPRNHGPDEDGHGHERLSEEVERLRDGIAVLRSVDASYDAVLSVGDEEETEGSR